MKAAVLPVVLVLASCKGSAADVDEADGDTAARNESLGRSGGSGEASAAADPQLDGAKLLDEAARAAGFADDGPSSIHQTGTLRSGEREGTFELWWTPAGFLLEQRWGSQVLRTGKDGSMVWEQDHEGNLSVAGGLGAGQVEWGAQPSPVMNWRRYFDRVQVMGEDGGRVTLELRGTRVGTARVVLRRDSLAVEEVAYDSGGEATRMQYFDVMETAGLRLPGRIVADVADVKVVQSVVTTEVGVPVDDPVFSRPRSGNEPQGAGAVVAVPSATAQPLPPAPARTGMAREVGGPPLRGD